MTENNTAPNKNLTKPKKWGWLILFASVSTLLCCALPIILVSLGMGAAVAAMASNVPFLIELSQYKAWVFAGSGIILLVSGWAFYRPGRVCPTDPELAKLCMSAQKWNRYFFWGAAIIWSIGFFAAFIAVHIFY